jgi:hypothetical protein
VLPLPNENVKKTDINDFFMRDGGSNADFAELATGKRRRRSRSDARRDHREPAGGGGVPHRAGHPAQGWSTADRREAEGRQVDHGRQPVRSRWPPGSRSSSRFSVPGLPVDPGVRTLLLDRELSKRSLFQRLDQLMKDRPGYQAAHENLLIDHDHLIKLDQNVLRPADAQLVEQNGAEV